MEEPISSVKILMSIADAFNRRDKEAVSKLVSEDVIYTIYGSGPQVGVYRGREDVLSVIGLAARLGLIAKPVFFLADGEYLFVISKLTGRGEGKSLETENCYLYRFRDGKLVEGRNIPTDQYAFDEYCK